MIMKDYKMSPNKHTHIQCVKENLILRSNFQNFPIKKNIVHIIFSKPYLCLFFYMFIIENIFSPYFFGHQKAKKKPLLLINNLDY